MTTTEIISSIIAALSLVASGITAYLTLWKRFDGAVVPMQRPVLLQTDNIPCLGLHCEVSNYGARAGTIMDIVVSLHHSPSGNTYTMMPYLTCDDFNVRDPNHVFRMFSGVFIVPKQTRTLFVVFRANSVSSFKPEEGTYTTLFRNSVRGKPKNSKADFSITIDSSRALIWATDPNKTQQIDSNEIAKYRDF
jgi:hypothetical protein